MNGLADALVQGEDGAYAGFISGEEPARAYPEITRKRLREVKRRYDPDNLFRLNQNIRPDSPPSLFAQQLRPVGRS